jgi:AcrR family transcriptional regulator
MAPRSPRLSRNNTVSDGPIARPPLPGSRAEAKGTQRQRLLDAMAHLVGARGYLSVSVAHVIEAAGVSRKTFYEHFGDKLDCFLEAYESSTQRLAEALADLSATPAAGRTERQLRQYLMAITESPTVTRAFIVEVMGAGDAALRARERVNRRFADLVFGHLSADEKVRKALIGGVNDVVTGELLAGRRRFLPLLPSLLRFVEGRAGVTPAG